MTRRDIDRARVVALYVTERKTMPAIAAIMKRETGRATATSTISDILHDAGVPSRPCGTVTGLTNAAKVRALRAALEALLEARCLNCGFSGGLVEREDARKALEDTKP